MAFDSPSILSTTNGELLDQRRFWGVEYVIRTAGAETRKLIEPSEPNQRVQLVAGTVVGACTIDAPSGQDFDGAGGDQILLTTAGQWIVLESFTIEGLLEWRVISKHTGVSVA